MQLCRTLEYYTISKITKLEYTKNTFKFGRESINENEFVGKRPGCMRVCIADTIEYGGIVL